MSFGNRENVVSETTEPLAKRRAVMRDVEKRGRIGYVAVFALTVVVAVAFVWSMPLGLALMLSFVFWVVMVLAVHLMQSDVRARAMIKPEDLLRAITAAQAFDLSPVTTEYRARHGLSEADAALHEREFRRWVPFAVIAYSAAPRWPSAGQQLPAYWNVLNGQPALFQSLRVAILGEDGPLELRVVEGFEAQEPYAELWVAYGFAYGEDPDPALWPKPGFPALASIRLQASHNHPGSGLWAAHYAAYVEKPHQSS
jgi:hypothetical protein